MNALTDNTISFKSLYRITVFPVVNIKSNTNDGTVSY